MREITSRNNETLKYYAALSDKKHRDAEGLFLVEGRKMVSEGVQRGGLCALFLREDEPSEEILTAAKRAGLSEDRIYLLSEPAFDKLSDAKAPQGVIGCFRKPENLSNPLSGDVLVLDGISDPGNLGTLLRTAAACGFSVLAADCADLYSPKCVRSTMSGIFAAKVRVCTGAEALELARGAGLEICVADMDGENFFQSTLSRPVALVVGNEANGVSERFRRAADRRLSIPMDNGIESLNAAVCGSAMMLTLRHSRR